MTGSADRETFFPDFPTQESRDGKEELPPLRTPPREHRENTTGAPFCPGGQREHLGDGSNSRSVEPRQAELFRQPGRRSRRQPRAEREQVLVRQVLAFLHRRGIVAWRQNSGASSGTRPNGKRYFVRFNSMPGMSDVLAVLPGSGRLMAIEAKTQTGKLTDEQEQFLEAVTRSGGLGIVARCLTDVTEALELCTGAPISSPAWHELARVPSWEQPVTPLAGK